jgi:hypothetical protein
MDTNVRLISLRNKHAALETRISRELTRPYPDQLQVQSWKKHKLALRDLICQIQMRKLPANTNAQA